MIGIAISATIVTVEYRFAVPKRAAPTLTLTTTNISVVQPTIQNATTMNASLSSQVAADTSGVNLNISGFSGLTVNAVTLINTDTTIFAQSEL